MSNIVHPNLNPYNEPPGCLGSVIAVVLAILLLMLTGCRSPKYIPVEVTSTDSVVVHDTLIQTELVPYRDSVSVLPSVGDTTAASFLSNPYAFSWARWDGRSLQHSLSIWPGNVLTIRIPYYIDRVRRIEVPKVVEVEKPLTRWQKFKMEFGGISFGACIGLTAILLWIVFIKRRL